MTAIYFGAQREARLSEATPCTHLGSRYAVLGIVEYDDHIPLSARVGP